MKLPTSRQLASFLLSIGFAVGIYLISFAAWQTVKDCAWCAAAAGAVLCLFCTSLLHRLKKLHLPHGWDFPPKLAGIALLGGTGVHWAATAAEHWLIELLHHHYGWLAACGLVLASASAALAYRFRRQFIRTRTHRLEQTKERRPHLLWFLSTARNPGIRSNDVLYRDGKWYLRRTLKDRPEPEETLLPVDQGISKLNQTLDSLQPRWNAQQLIRALAHQFDGCPRCLTDLWVVASTGSGGSSAERAALLPMLRALPEMHGVTIHPADTNDGRQEMLVDFENMEALQKEVFKIVARTRGQAKQLTIDCTGGQKTTSIAAAIATINNDALVQYVGTQQPFEVLTYNCVVEYEALPGGD